MTDTENSQAPAQEGVDNTDANLSVEDFASSFVEKVEAEAEDTSTEATEDVTESEVVDADESEDSNDVLLQSSDEEEDSDDLDQDESIDESSQPKGLQKALKQINRLTARAKGAEETVQSLKDEIQSLKSQPTESTKAEKPDLNNIQNLKDLESLRKEAYEAKKWALQNLGKQDIVELDGREYEDEEIRNILTESEEYLSVRIPQRAQFLNDQQAWLQDAQNTFPWISKGEGPEYELFLQVREGEQYKKILDSIPNGHFVAATLVEGINSIKSRQKTKPVKKVKTPPQTDMGDAIAPPPQSKEARREKKRKAILGKGNVSVQQFAQFLNT